MNYPLALGALNSLPQFASPAVPASATVRNLLGMFAYLDGKEPDEQIVLGDPAKEYSTPAQP